MADESVRILAHGKMAEALHDGHLSSGNAGGDGQRLLRRTGIIVFAGQQKKRATFGVDPADPIADVAVDLVEIQIALKTPGPPCM